MCMHLGCMLLHPVVALSEMNSITQGAPWGKLPTPFSLAKGLRCSQWHFSGSVFVAPPAGAASPEVMNGKGGSYPSALMLLGHFSGSLGGRVLAVLL